MFLDEDGNGNVRRYYLVSGVKTYADAIKEQLITQQVKLP